MNVIRNEYSELVETSQRLIEKEHELFVKEREMSEKYQERSRIAEKRNNELEEEIQTLRLEQDTYTAVKSQLQAAQSFVKRLGGLIHDSAQRSEPDQLLQGIAAMLDSLNLESSRKSQRQNQDAVPELPTNEPSPETSPQALSRDDATPSTGSIVIGYYDAWPTHWDVGLTSPIESNPIERIFAGMLRASLVPAPHSMGKLTGVGSLGVNLWDERQTTSPTEAGASATDETEALSSWDAKPADSSKETNGRCSWPLT